MVLQQTVGTNVAPSLGEKTWMTAALNGVELAVLGAPVLEDVDRIVNELDPVADGAMTIIAQPDVPRNLTVTVVDANASSSGSGVIEGFDMAGRALTESFTWAAAGTQALSKIFARVTSVIISDEAGAAAGDTLGIGVGAKIGLPKPIAVASGVKYVSFAAVPLTNAVIEVDDGAGNSSINVTASTYDGTKELKAGYQPGL